jgi:hypothetical protein
MTHIMPDAPPTTGTPRSLHAICEDARRGQCGYCSAMPGEPCVFSGTGPDGYHLARFAWAEATGLITATDFAAALETLAGRPFGNATVFYDNQLDQAGPVLVNLKLVTFTVQQAAVIAKALADAEVYRREGAEAYCYDCADNPAGACEDHLDNLDQADAYRHLAAELAGPR